MALQIVQIFLVTTTALVASLIGIGIGILPNRGVDAGVEKRQAECFSPFYKPAWCYGFGFPPNAGFGGFGGFGGGAFGGTAGFGPYGGAGAGGFGFGGPRYAPGFGSGFGVGTGSSTGFGSRIYDDDYEDEDEEEKPHFEKYTDQKQHTRPKNPYGFNGVGGGSYAGSGTGFGPGPFGFGQFGGAGGGGGFGGFGSPFYNPFQPFPNFGSMPTITSFGPGSKQTSGSSTFSFGPGGKTTQSTSNQMMTTDAPDASWTIQSSGLQMETEPRDGTILVTADVGKPTRVEREHVSEHEFQVNFSYKHGPKKWINLKVEDDGPNLEKIRVEQRGSTVYIRGPPPASKRG